MKPMLDLKKQYIGIKDELISEITSVLESSQFVLGPKVREFEEKVAAYHKAEDAIAVASGTDALHLALVAFGVGKGDEVITTPFTFFATTEAILYTGAKPVFVDIEPDTFNIDPAKIAKKIRKKTKAIMPVHMFGHPADMDAIMKIADKHGLGVVEDCAQSFGASINGKMTGSFGDFGAFSFYPSKNLGAYGDGGIITVRDKKHSEKIRSLRNHGSAGGYAHKYIGWNSRLDEIQAAILLVKLKRINEYNELRRRNAGLYNTILSPKFKTPVERPGCKHVYHQYTIRCQDRDRVKDSLGQKGIPSVIYYPIPVHLQEAVSFLSRMKGDFPIAEAAANEVLSLPMYPELAKEDIEEAAKALLSV